MSKNEISQGDCPHSPAAPYPGKYGHNNKTGSKLSRNEFKKAQVRLWVSHFSGNPKYENTHLAHKVIYLSQYLQTENSLLLRMLCTIICSGRSAQLRTTRNPCQASR